jgi:hypothetical protein
MVTYRIDLEPADQDKARMSWIGADLGTSRQPLFKAARMFLLGGADPEDRIETWRGNTLCLAGPVWAAAKLTVEDGDGCPRFTRWKPFAGLRGRQL